MTNYQATIRNLVPDLDQAKEPRFKETKYSARTLGSRLLNLKRVSRLPSTSRRYMIGDPTRLIDWRAFARNDQLIVREIRDEASSRINICLDLSETMDWPQQHITKQEIAIRIAYHLLYSHLKVGDLVCFLIWFRGETQPSHQVYLRSPSETIQSFYSLSKNGFHAKDFSAICAPRRHHDMTYDVGYLISDMLRVSDIDWFFHFNRTSKLLHTLSSRELNFDWLDDSVTYFDRSSSKKEYLGSTFKKDHSYFSSIDSWRGSLESEFKLAGGSYQLLTENTNLNEYFENVFE